MRQLLDGEMKVMRSKFSFFDNEVKVTAYREDSDSPFVILSDENGQEFRLTDVGAQSLVERINKALSILPSSK